MKKREEMTPEEIQEFMRREQEELDKMLGKAVVPPAPTLAEEEKDEDEVISFDPSTGKAVQVESTILTREKAPGENMNEQLSFNGDISFSGGSIQKKKSFDVFEEALKQKAAHDLFHTYRDMAWNVEESIKKMRHFISAEEKERLLDMTDEWAKDCHLIKSVGIGVKDIEDLKKEHQDLLERKMKEYAEEILDIL